MNVLVLVCCVQLASSLFVGVAESRAQGVRQYSHAYYLFLAPPADPCETCYVPLLLTSKPLDEVARAELDETCVVITTHERDSIVSVERGLVVSSANIQIQARHVRLRDRAYRYQEISAAEVLRLLEHPEGTIPIHRTFDMGPPSRAELEGLIASFRALK